MGINASSKGSSEARELIPADNYLAICVRMIEIGTTTENIMGKTKQLHKVRIGWELPELTKVFDEAKGAQPLVIDKEYTLSLADKATLRADLKSWRGKDFTPEELEKFDITKLLGAYCMLNIIEKPSKKDPTKIYNDISGITKVHKDVQKLPQTNTNVILSYEDWKEDIFQALPDFIKDKIISTPEYHQLRNPDEDKFVDDDGKLLEGQNGTMPDDSDEELPF